MEAHSLFKRMKPNMSKAFQKKPMEHCDVELDYEIIAQSDTYSLLEVHFLTGIPNSCSSFHQWGHRLKGFEIHSIEAIKMHPFTYMHAKWEFIHPVKRA